MYGFAKGISATFYGSILAGLVYFTSYKYLKENFILAGSKKESEKQEEGSFLQFFACSVVS